MNLEIWKQRAYWLAITVLVGLLFVLGAGAGYWSRVCR